MRRDKEKLELSKIDFCLRLEIYQSKILKFNVSFALRKHYQKILPNLIFSILTLRQDDSVATPPPPSTSPPLLKGHHTSATIPQA
jgi:hypothetical protein